MAITVKHKFVSAIPDGTDTSVVRPSNWNDDHDFSGTLPVANGGTGVTSSSGANSVVLRDTNGNITTNCLFEGYVTQAASATPIVLTVSSAQNWQITGSGGQTIKLPDATTLPNGATFTFNNNQSSGTIVVQNNSSTTVATINSGGYVTVVLLSNSIAAGSWDKHDSTPSNVSWSTNTLDYAGSITSATWNGNTVAYNRGGTGQSSAFVAGGVAYGASTSALGVTSAGTSGQVLTSAGASAPTFSSALTGLSIDNSVIGGTTPAAGTFTTITGQTEVLKGTGENLLLYSSVLTNAAWTQTNVTLTGSQSDAFGGNSAFLMNNGTATGNHEIKQFLSVTNIFTYTIYAKAGTANFFGIYAITPAQGVFFNLTTGAFSANILNAPTSYSSTNVGNGWWRLSITASNAFGGVQLLMSEDGTNFSYTGTSKTVTIFAPQAEVGTYINTYVPTTTTAVYGTPTLSFSGVAGLGLQSDGSLYVSPAGTGALQAQATTSSTVGGNARGANAVDWQTTRGSASSVASGTAAVLAGGYNNTVGSSYSGIASGFGNNTIGSFSFIGGGSSNQTNTQYSYIVGGNGNNANGQYNFIGGGYTNSATASAAVTTQSSTMNGTTAVTLGASNGSIKVGQYVSGTYIAGDTYVAAVSGTSLTLSKNASGSGTSTLSFYTPHGVVVGGGNNQATGSYSFIGGGGDAGTSSNRNVASGDWSVVAGGFKNTASGLYSVVSGGGYNTASGTAAFVGGGGTNGSTNYANTASGLWTVAVGGLSSNATGTGAFVGGGFSNTANGQYSSIVSGSAGTTRNITGNAVFPACLTPISSTLGVSQAALLILAKQTTDATATVLTSDGSAASTTNQVILPDNSAYLFKATVIANVTGGGNTSGWKLEGVIKRGSGVGSAAIVGLVTTTLLAQDAGAATWAVTATADTTNGGLKITVTGQASTTIRWVAKVDTTEVTF
jgi:hypothetical protein